MTKQEKEALRRLKQAAAREPTFANPNRVTVRREDLEAVIALLRGEARPCRAAS